jgi:hypothetical protein
MAGIVRWTLAILSPLALAHAGTIGLLPPPCPATSTPLSSYVALGPAGCAIGGFSVSDFQFAVQPGGTGTPIGASAVGVTWATTPAALGLRFSSTGFQAGPGESLGYWLSYNIDPVPAVMYGFGDTLWTLGPPDVGSPPPIIRGGDEEDGGGVEAVAALLALGSVTIDTQLCAGGVFTGSGDARACSLGSTIPLSIYYTGVLPRRTSTAFPAPVSTVGVLNSIVLEGGEFGAGFWALDNQANLVPEPAGWLLMGAGLALLGLLARRRVA